MDWMGNRAKDQDRLGWIEAPLTQAWAGFELCYDCDGCKLCSRCNGEGFEDEDGRRARCPACGGTRWCPVCGGAGQWPLDPATPYFAPQPPLINLHSRAAERAKKRT